MKFTFILSQITPSRLPHYNYAVGALSASLKEAGQKTSLLHYIKPVSEKELIKSILEESPDIVGFTAATNAFHHVKQMAMCLKRHFDFPIICGDVHPTLAPESSISEEGIDIICIGEGEGALIDLCNKMERGEDITSIPNLWVKRDGEVFKNPPRPLIENLDSLPFQDRSIFDYENLNESKNGVARVMVSRGCPYDCTYCCNSQIREVYENKGKYVRFNSVDRVLAEMEQMIKTYPFIEFLLFNDDILPLKMDWLRQFAEEYPERIGLPFRCNCRPDLLNEERVKLLRKAGCAKVNIGVESGNKYIRSKVLNRNITRNQMIDAFALCRKEGIATQAYNMVGLPFENPSSILDTIKLNAQIQPDMTQRSIFYPYPKTKLYDICHKNKFLTQKEFDTFFEGTILSQPTISEAQVNFAFQFFYLFLRSYILCQKLPPPLRTLGERTLDFFFTSNVIPHRLLAASKKAIMSMLYKFHAFLRQKRFAYLYSLLMFLRSKKEGRLRVIED